MRNLFVLFLLLLLKTGSLQAGTIVVTTNADSGSGSLREAITIAAVNGIVTIDTIVFNIPDTSRAARTITIGDHLPDLTSNLIIDASTQQGGKIGKSDAKIILLLSTIQTSAFYFFNFIGAKNVQIYGFFFYKNFSTAFSPGQTFDVGIRFVLSENIIIGKPGKGNYFRGMYFGIYNPMSDVYADRYKRNSTNIIIQSNIIGHNKNGEPIIQNYPGSSYYADNVTNAILITNSKDILIGGNLPAQGNSFYSEKIQVYSGIKDDGSLVFKNNNAGTNTDGTVFDNNNNLPIQINLGSNSISPENTDYKIQIINNVLIAGIDVYNTSGI